jgi:hypothetical protein
MLNPTEQPWAEFADRVAQELLEHNVSEAVMITRSESEDRVTTNYFNCNFEKRCIMIGHMLEDLVLEIIDVNAEQIREILEEEE